MNFLSICQEVHAILGLQGTFSSASGATGQAATLAKLVISAWEDIQNLRQDWDFLRTSVTFNLTTSSTDYSILAMFGTTTNPVSHWRMVLYDDSPLRRIDIDEYIITKVDEQTGGLPAVYTVVPEDNTLKFNPVSTTYSVTGYYFRKPQVLSANADVPLAPTEFHRAIVYRAATDMATYLGDQGTYYIYSQKAASLIGSLMRSENPSKRISLARVVV